MIGGYTFLAEIQYSKRALLQFRFLTTVYLAFTKPTEDKISVYIFSDGTEFP